jgi:hypothetical protein
MAEKRKIKRTLKRLKLRYGVNRASTLAFTEDVSETGVFVRTVNVMGPGVIMQVELFMPDNVPVTFEAMVVWSRRVPGSLIHLSKGGMGLLITKFVSGEEKYLDFCRSVAGKQEHTPGLAPSTRAVAPDKQP